MPKGYKGKVVDAAICQNPTNPVVPGKSIDKVAEKKAKSRIGTLHTAKKIKMNDL